MPKVPRKDKNYPFFGKVIKEDDSRIYYELVISMPKKAPSLQERWEQEDEFKGNH